jgi:hypothetical protein
VVITAVFGAAVLIVALAVFSAFIYLLYAFLAALTSSWIAGIFVGIGVLAGLRNGFGSAIPNARDRRQPNKHRWLTNGLKPRKMHFGPRRLF